MVFWTKNRLINSIHIIHYYTNPAVCNVNRYCLPSFHNRLFFACRVLVSGTTVKETIRYANARFNPTTMSRTNNRFWYAAAKGTIATTTTYAKSHARFHGGLLRDRLVHKAVKHKDWKFIWVFLTTNFSVSINVYFFFLWLIGIFGSFLIPHTCIHLNTCKFYPKICYH